MKGTSLFWVFVVLVPQGLSALWVTRFLPIGKIQLKFKGSAGFTAEPIIARGHGYFPRTTPALAG